MGAQARAFADFLAQGGQSCWQILPIGPTGYGDSPYQSFSTFAGNPYFIDLDDLARRGLLQPEEYQSLFWGDDPERVDYQALYQNRFSVLRLACRRLEEREGEALASFCREEAGWLEDYALFMALKEENGGRPWMEWPQGERLRRPQALEQAKDRLGEETAFWKGVQYLFFTQWRALKKYVNGLGIALLGDVPIYVAGDSADVWANPEQFQLDENGLPTQVAGCPPDGFLRRRPAVGQPLFCWEADEGGGLPVVAGPALLPVHPLRHPAHRPLPGL